MAESITAEPFRFFKIIEETLQDTKLVIHTNLLLYMLTLWLVYTNKKTMKYDAWQHVMCRRGHFRNLLLWGVFCYFSLSFLISMHI